jgi:hypothetical protein
MNVPSCVRCKSDCIYYILQNYCREDQDRSRQFSNKNLASDHFYVKIRNYMKMVVAKL